MGESRKVIPISADADGDAPGGATPIGDTALVGRGAELNLRILQSLARYMAHEHGNRAFESIANDVGLTPRDFKKSRWVSHAVFEAFLAGCRATMKDDAEFSRACAFELKEGYGAFAWVIRGLSPRLVFEASTRNIKMISRISTYEIVDKGPNFIRGRYSSQRPESRLMCISRQAQMRVMTQLWGLPPAELEEHACIAHGDGHCEYHLRWYNVPRWLPAFGGSLLGALIAFAVFGLSVADQVFWVTVPALGAALGYIVDTVRTRRVNLELSNDINQALREVAHDEAEARAELLAFRQRDYDWSRRLDERVAERIATLQKINDRIRAVQEEKHSSIRSVSHDLKSPLHVLKNTGVLLERHIQQAGDAAEIVKEHDSAVNQMEALLDDLLNLATAGAEAYRLKPEVVEVAPLTDGIRSRLRALVGRDIRISVFRTRDAPERIHTDLLLLNRVIDNLLTNAVKYTARGSILVEVGGKPDYLTINVTDCGRGISPEELEAIFRPGGSDEKARAPRSFGLGLSIVLQLLGQIGGRLEVRSKVGEGTTFWAHFPVEMRPPSVVFEQTPREGESAYAELLQRVVTIRKT